MISVISNSLSLKYQNITQSGCKDIWIRNFQFVTKTHFLCTKFFYHKQKQETKQSTLSVIILSILILPFTIQELYNVLLFLYRKYRLGLEGSVL